MRRSWITDVTARPRRAESVAGLLGMGLPWPALWELGRGNQWRRLQLLRRQMDPRKEPVLTVVLLAQASNAVGDTAEARVLEKVFGPALDGIPVSSTKSMTGHLLSAAAAIEAVACLTAIEQQRIPPTINLDSVDPECELCHVPHQAIARPVSVAISNSFGFGGSNTTLVLRRAA